MKILTPSFSSAPCHASCYNGGNPNGQFAQVGEPAHATVLRNALAPLPSALFTN
ncbi:hypothetical protein [Calothrix sp. NIES-2098]|uniref:hypothetical protein n=1 Tax=Calothrix sp. NIES-2098 TaxID=1954171 RepID=UPI0030D85CF1